MKKICAPILCLALPLHASSQPTPALDQQALHNHFWFNYQRYAGKQIAAQNWFEKTLQTNTPPSAYKSYLKHLAQTGQYNLIAKLAPRLEKQFTKDPAIQLLFAQSLEKAGSLTEAHKRILKLSDSYKDNQEIALSAAQIYMQRKQPDKALKAISQLINQKTAQPNTFILHFLKAEILVKLQKPKDALTEIKACLSLQSRFDTGWLLRALLEEQLGNIPEAIKGYRAYLDLAGANPKIEYHMNQLKQNKKVPLLTPYSLRLPESSLPQAQALFANAHRYAYSHTQTVV